MSGSGPIRPSVATRWIVARGGRFMLVYLALLIGLGFAFWRLPGGFVPIDDQGFVIVDVLAPSSPSGECRLAGLGGLLCNSTYGQR